MLFASTALAARIERAEARLVGDAASAAARRRPEAGCFATPLAGGVATFTAQGSPLNKVAGLGFAGPLDPAELDSVERAFAARGVPVQVELSCLADPQIAALLTAPRLRARELRERARLPPARPAAGAARGDRDRPEPRVGARRVARPGGERLREPGSAGRAVARVVPPRRARAGDGRDGGRRGLRPLSGPARRRAGGRRQHAPVRRHRPALRSGDSARAPPQGRPERAARGAARGRGPRRAATSRSSRRSRARSPRRTCSAAASSCSTRARSW